MNASHVLSFLMGAAFGCALSALIVILTNAQNKENLVVLRGEDDFTEPLPVIEDGKECEERTFGNQGMKWGINENKKQLVLKIPYSAFKEASESANDTIDLIYFKGDDTLAYSSTMDIVVETDKSVAEMFADWWKEISESSEEELYFCNKATNVLYIITINQGMYYDSIVSRY